MDIKKITQEEAAALLNSGSGKGYAPLGQFWLRSKGGKYIAIDNSTGEAWTDEFRTKRSCMKYLRGEPCTDAHGTRLNI